MAEQDEQLFADAADALAAPLEGDEPAEGDDVFHDSEEELEDEAMEEEEAAEDGKLPILWGKFFAENFCRETRTCSGSARTLARVSLHPHPPVCAPSAATRVLAARAAVLGARGGTLFSASACLSHRPACFRLLVQPLRRSRRFLWWSLYRCASVIN